MKYKTCSHLYINIPLLDLLDEARQLKNEHSTVLKSVGVADRIHWLLKLQRAMASLTEVGDQKLEVTSEMLDTVRNYCSVTF